MLGEVACGFSSPHFYYIMYLTCTLPTSPLYNLTSINYTCFLSDSVAEMRHQDKFPDVHWIWKGGISYVFEVHPRIVVKVPKIRGIRERAIPERARHIQYTFPFSSVCFPGTMLLQGG